MAESAAPLRAPPPVAGGRRLRVLAYSDHGEIVGGDAKYLLELLSVLHGDNFEFTLFANRHPDFPRRAAQWLKAAVPIVYLDTRPAYPGRSWSQNIGPRSRLSRALDFPICGRECRRYLRSLGDLILLRWPRETLRNVRVLARALWPLRGTVDVLHVNSGGYPGRDSGLIAVLLARLLGVRRVLLSIHNEPVPRSWAHPVWRAHDFLLGRLCDGIIAASENLRQGLLRERGFRPEQVRTLYCGLADLPDIPESDRTALRASLGLNSNSIALLLCGNWEEQRKGHDILLKALSRIRDGRPELILLLVGTGGLERERFLHGLVSSLGLEGRVRFLGYRDDVHALNCASDIAVVPSTCEEATPYTIKEAARAARPVIASRAGGCSDAVKDGVTGLLVPPGDDEALAAAIERLCASPETRRRMGEAARGLFLDRFLLERQARAHAQLYRGGSDLASIRR